MSDFVRSLTHDLRSAYTSNRAVSREKSKGMSIRVVVDAQAPADFVLQVKGLLIPETNDVTIQVDRLAEVNLLRALSPQDAVICILGVDTEFATEVANAYAQDHTPVCLIQGAGVKAPEPSAMKSRTQGPISLVQAPTPEDIDGKLGQWFVDTFDSQVVLAQSFAFLRKRTVDQIVRDTAIQNAVIAGMPFGAAADMYAMTANEIKMVFSLAGVYGQDMWSHNLYQVAAVVGSSFVFRGLSRLVPAENPYVRKAANIGIGYGATMALGIVLNNYYKVKKNSKIGSQNR